MEEKKVNYELGKMWRSGCVPAVAWVITRKKKKSLQPGSVPRLKSQVS